MVLPALDVPRLVSISVVMWIIYRRYCDCRSAKEEVSRAEAERSKFSALVYGD